MGAVMPEGSLQGIRHPLLERIGVSHAFAVPGEFAAGTTATGSGGLPPGIGSRVARPRQVHGATATRVRDGVPERADADAILATADPGRGGPVGIITADCVPILAVTASGKAVAAIHAGWRGLAGGVIEIALAALREHAAVGEEVTAVVGPHIEACCYEVDAAVIDPLTGRFGAPSVTAATVPSRPGHWQLDLAALVRVDLERAGIPETHSARIASACTFCDPRGFASYRRDGDAADRMLHYVAPCPSMNH